ncbi:unnamed protein product [Ostreobium quekettii]|uniref:SnoaL-like domain-containing protein n=1 Tax=Ostreobium quekettii TaxID=121088 RepID=A0A8S1IMM1_9CHLO|nr:unnamed protein product [Ostreobium quekettii]
MDGSDKAAQDWFADGRICRKPPQTPEPPTMIDSEFARGFAEEWIEAWNSHDLDRILAHYTDDFEMSSPFIVEIAGDASGTLRGREAVGAYWKRALERMPELRFELVDVLVGAQSVVIYYKSVKGRMAAEALTFDDDGRVVRGSGHYSR